MGMQWESATLPDAVSPFFGRCIHLVYNIYRDEPLEDAYSGKACCQWDKVRRPASASVTKCLRDDGHGNHAEKNFILNRARSGRTRLRCTCLWAC